MTEEISYTKNNKELAFKEMLVLMSFSDSTGKPSFSSISEEAKSHKKLWEQECNAMALARQKFGKFVTRLSIILVMMCFIGLYLGLKYESIYFVLFSFGAVIVQMLNVIFYYRHHKHG